MWKLSHYTIIETVEPFKLHPTSMSYIYKVFEHLKQLWMFIWQHIHTVTTTEVSPDLGEFTEILDGGIDPTTLLLRLKNLSKCIPHPCLTYIRCLNTLNSCGWAYGSTFIPLPPQSFPQIWESSLKSYDVNVETIQLRYRRSCRTFQTAFHIYVIHI
jgi:hypothetical protein